MRALLPILVVLMATNCTPTPSATPQQTASANPALDTPTLLYGDEALKSRLKRALAAKGEKYEPRTKHLRGDGSPKFTNRLILETSPYLAQHAHNPVNWFPWGDEAFEVARKLGRPVFLSVGYSTCHWCHVMEEESFEDEAIAKYLNDHYVMIKVDREERPDVDAIYMRAVQILTRRGGWPMSVWLTPEGKPFYGGTYFPARDGDGGTRKGFITILKEQYDSFKGDPAGIASDSTRLAARVQEDLKPIASSGLPGAVSLQMAVEMAGRTFDPEYGGSRGKPKFPSSFPVRTLLRYGRRAKDDNATAMALTTLSKMAAGGMYDHVAGGFHRYSTDARWLVPHFEKMLYDNALLAIAYIEGYQASGDTELLRVAREILDYVVRDMTSPEGGYYSATDADSIGPKGHREEGYYFTWTPSELERTLGPGRAATVGQYYAVKPGGNFEGRSILHTPRDKAAVAKQLKISVAELDAEIAAARPLLLTERNKRPAPIRDDKIQVSWNGLMLAAMARGARVL
ncbi:MAG: thioredoxin domain-containing protein, partial [Polyangiaceae bacterium]